MATGQCLLFRQNSLQFKDDFARAKASNKVVQTPRKQNRETETPVGLKPTVIQSRKTNLEITKGRYYRSSRHFLSTVSVSPRLLYL